MSLDTEEERLAFRAALNRASNEIRDDVKNEKKLIYSEILSIREEIESIKHEIKNLNKKISASKKDLKSVLTFFDDKQVKAHKMIGELESLINGIPEDEFKVIKNICAILSDYRDGND